MGHALGLQRYVILAAVNEQRANAAPATDRIPADTVAMGVGGGDTSFYVIAPEALIHPSGCGVRQVRGCTNGLEPVGTAD
jgi:hypothetical protein